MDTVPRRQRRHQSGNLSPHRLVEILVCRILATRDDEWETEQHRAVLFHGEEVDFLRNLRHRSFIKFEHREAKDVSPSPNHFSVEGNDDSLLTASDVLREDGEGVVVVRGLAVVGLDGGGAGVLPRMPS